jgi:hypothetical protein
LWLRVVVGGANWWSQREQIQHEAVLATIRDIDSAPTVIQRSVAVVDGRERHTACVNGWCTTDSVPLLDSAVLPRKVSGTIPTFDPTAFDGALKAAEIASAAK